MLDRFLADALAAAPDIVAVALAADGSGSDQVANDGRTDPSRLEALAQVGSLAPAPVAGGGGDAQALLRPVPMTNDALPRPASLAEVFLGSLAAATVAGALTGSGVAASRRHPWQWSRRK